MAVRFVIGRAGTGKTRRCFDAIVADMRADALDGPPIYWILPKQATFSAERELTTLSGLGAFCRARVLSFELLGEEVLASCGGAAVPEVSAIGRQMLLGFLLRSRQDQLKFFRGVARQPGLAARLDATFAEFERCGKDPAAVAELIDQLTPAPRDANGDNHGDGNGNGNGDGDGNGNGDAATRAGAALETDLLRDKLVDFHLLFKAYRDALGDERVDPHRRLEQVLACINDHRALRGAAVYIDGFLEFTERERRMIVALAKAAANVEITLPIDPRSPTIADVHHLPDDLSLFHRTESQYRQLAVALAQAGAVVEKPLLLKSTRRFADPALAAVEKSLFNGGYAIQPRHADALEMVEAPDRRSEVDAAARRIRSLLQDGLRLRDVALLVRDIDQYEELIAASFREHDIPYFVDRRRSAGHHPLLQFTRSVFQVARHAWPHEAVMALVKSGLAGVDLADADALENYVLLHRVRGVAWGDREPWAFHRTLTRGREDRDDVVEQADHSAEMDLLRRHVADGVAPFVALLREPRTVREIVVALFELFQRFGVREQLGRWIDESAAANDPEQRGEHEQVWAELIKLFDQMVDLLGEQRVELADFVEILDVGLEQFDLALTPPRVDQVLVGQVERTRTTSPHTVFLLGLSEGQFPKVAREDSVLSDGERRSLRARNLDVDPDSERRLLDENLLGYIAFTRASHRLIVSRPTAEETKPVNPSAFWSKLTRMFPHNRPTRERRESEAAHDAIGTPRQLVTALMRWARRDDAAADADQPWAQLYQFLADHTKFDDSIGVMRYKAWRAVGYKNDARLSPDVARRLAGEELHASVTRIETFATCPFKHFARYGLGLAEREEEDVTAMDLGNVYHNILERIVERVLRDRGDWCELQPKVNQQLIMEFAAEVGRSLRGEVMLSTARNKYLLKRIEKTLDRVCATQRAVLARGAFRPAFAELGFGAGNNALPPLLLKTPKGRSVLLHGKIDRIDLARDGAEVAVIDYKMRDSTLELDSVYHGLSLQLLTYLLVLQSSGDAIFRKKVTPVAAFYARLLRNLEPVKHPSEALDPAEPAFDLRTKPRGIVDARFLSHLDNELQTGTSEVVHCQIKQDGTIGRINASDAAAGDAFAALLAFVERKIGQLADRMIGGSIAVQPYRMALETPCARCEYRSVCRFDPAVNGYLHLPAMSRSAVLEMVTAPREAADA